MKPASALITLVPSWAIKNPSIIRDMAPMATVIVAVNEFTFSNMYYFKVNSEKGKIIKMGFKTFDFTKQF